MFEQGAESFGILAAGLELVVADRAGARPLAGEAGALAVEFTLEFCLPETEFGLQSRVLGSEFRDLRVNGRQAVLKRLGGIGDGGLEFVLLRGGETGNGGTGVLVILNDEFGLEGFVPPLALFGESLLQADDHRADFFLLRFEAVADDLDFRSAVFFYHRMDRVAEQQKDERVGDGDAHQHGDDEAEGELGEFAENREIGAVSGKQGTVDGKDNKGPDGGDGIDDARIVGDCGKCVGAGDEGERAGNEHGGTEGNVFPLLPCRALLQSFGACSGEPEKGAFDHVHWGRVSKGSYWRKALRFSNRGKFFR